MSGKRRYGRPGGGSLLAMMCVNGIVALIVLKLVFVVFGAGTILATGLAAHAQASLIERGRMLWPMLPGAAFGFSCLWFWLALIGRSRGVPWGAALLYGVAIAFANVPFSGFLVGLLHGNPLLGLLLALVSLLLLPSLAVSMIAFGLAMGAFNGLMAQRWIARHRPD
ncbi:MAG TPA: hypothetical protein VFB21_02605 [Chthonomonadaceae bacterium]|nr:hypothetical protein [Chthonomonadaceae bacterium]